MSKRKVSKSGDSLFLKIGKLLLLPGLVYCSSRFLLAPVIFGDTQASIPPAITQEVPALESTSQYTVQPTEYLPPTATPIPGDPTPTLVAIVTEETSPTPTIYVPTPESPTALPTTDIQPTSLALTNQAANVTISGCDPQLTARLQEVADKAFPYLFGDTPMELYCTGGGSHASTDGRQIYVDPNNCTQVSSCEFIMMHEAGHSYLINEALKATGQSYRDPQQLLDALPWLANLNTGGSTNDMMDAIADMFGYYVLDGPNFIQRYGDPVGGYNKAERLYSIMKEIFQGHEF